VPAEFSGFGRYFMQEQEQEQDPSLTTIKQSNPTFQIFFPLIFLRDFATVP